VSVDVRLLRYYLAVAEHLHFGRAAETLYISQPALSHQIRKLESDLGTSLFERDRRAVVLTAAGRALLESARLTVAASDEFTAQARLARRTTRRELCLGFMNRWPDGFVPAVLRSFHELRPDVSVEVRQFDFRDSTVGLRSGDTDVALLHMPLSWDGFESRTVATTFRVVMIAEEHPLARSASVTVTELVATGIPWATPPPEADPAWRESWGALPQRRAAGADLANSGIPVTKEEYFSKVATGALLGLTDGLIEEAYRPPGVAFVPVANLPPSIRSVGWRRGDDREHVHAMVDSIRRVAGADG
jgi:DNA-binding transcriptional LysR family regulator